MDENVTHVEGEVDPIRDIEIINEELRLKDEEVLLAYLDKIGRSVQRGDKTHKVEWVGRILFLVQARNYYHLHFKCGLFRHILHFLGRSRKS